MSKRNIVTFATIALLLSACAQNASWHANQVEKADKSNFTLGQVQTSVSKGMSGAEVIGALGSPNIVSTDENGNEVWVYDKFSTETVVSGSNGTTLSLSNIASGAGRRSQSTLTVIIKFNNAKRVRDVAYHKSSF